MPPVDECLGDPGFVKFRNHLQQVVERRDKKALLALLSPYVIVNFGGMRGPEAFAAKWDFDPRSHDSIWNRLEIMLRLGCAIDQGARVIPSLAVRFDPGDEVFDVMIVAKQGAQLRGGPEPGDPAIATLAWDVVKVVDQSGDLQTKVRIADGREGWMFDDDLYSPLNYRMVVEKLRDQWLITAFVAGD